MQLRDKAAYEIAHPRHSIVAAVETLALAPGMQVLDAGCGPGAHLALLARRLAPDGCVTGLDIDEERLAIAAELCAEEIAAGTVRLERGDVMALPFPAGVFDVVWSSLVLHHFDGTQAMLGALARVVRPGGMVAIMEGDHDGSFPLLPWPPEFEQRLRAAILRGEQERAGGAIPAISSGWIARALPRLLREAGLGEVSMHAFADLDRAPLDPQRQDELRESLLATFGRRAREWLAPADWARLEAYVDPASPDNLLSSPDFVLARTWFLATGRVN
jgi:ubiquinone/menaquinone biosynthesis C-methylase UbiE